MPACDIFFDKMKNMLLLQPLIHDELAQVAEMVDAHG